MRQRKQASQLQQTVSKAKELEKKANKSSSSSTPLTTRQIAQLEKERQQTHAKLASLMQSSGLVYQQPPPQNNNNNGADLQQQRSVASSRHTADTTPGGGSTFSHGYASTGNVRRIKRPNNNNNTNDLTSSMTANHNGHPGQNAAFDTRGYTVHSSLVGLPSRRVEGWDSLQGRRVSDGDTSDLSRLCTPSIRRGMLNNGSSNSSSNGPKRPSWNRSASFKSSLNQTQMRNILAKENNDDDAEDDDLSLPGGQTTTDGMNRNRKAPQSTSSFDRGNNTSRMCRVSSEGTKLHEMGDLAAVTKVYERGPRGNKDTLDSSAKNNTSITWQETSMGETMLIPTYRPQSNSSIKKGNIMKNGGNKQKDSKWGDVKQRISAGEIKRGNDTLAGQQQAQAAAGTSKNVRLDVTNSELTATKRGPGSTSKGVEITMNGLGEIKLEDLVPTRRISRDYGEIKLEDLVPTRRISRENSQRSKELSISSTDENEGNKKLIPTRDGGSSEQSLESDKVMAQNQGSGEGRADENTCPRSLILLNSQKQSRSGGTGPTQATSNSSLISSNASDSELNNNPANNNTPPGGSNVTNNFEAIKEEDRVDIGSSTGGASSVAERKSGDSFPVPQNVPGERDHDAEPPPGTSVYKHQRTGRIKKIRQSIRASLKGKADDGVFKSFNSEGEGSGSQGGNISIEQRERVSRHLERRGSNRSMSSVFSNFSAFGNSDSSTTSNASGRFARFRFKRGLSRARSDRHSMRSSLSSNGPCEDLGGSSSRQIIVTNARGSNSNLINLSHRSSASHPSEDEKSRSSRSNASNIFTDFYDHNDHVRAVSSLIKHQQLSGKSLSTNPLDPVRELSHMTVEEEQKYDEDYHHQQNMRKAMDTSNHSDDSVNSLYRHPSHNHPLVHMRPNQLFPNTPGWQCDECSAEEFDLNILAYVSTEKNYLLCERCFAKSGFSVNG